MAEAIADNLLYKTAENILSSDCQLRSVDYLNSSSKRRLDVMLGSALSVGFLGPIALAGAAVWFQDGHNPLVRMWRRNPQTGQRFPIYKIRTMVPNADKLEADLMQGKPITEFKRSSVDPRVTPLGKRMRNWSLDELPQLFSALRGDIYLVGPRAFSDREWDTCILPQANQSPYTEFLELLDRGIKFGVTGLYGIMGRADLSLEQRLKLEVLYGREANFVADLRIIGRTVSAVLGKKGAY